MQTTTTGAATVAETSAKYLIFLLPSFSVFFPRSVVFSPQRPVHECFWMAAFSSLLSLSSHADAKGKKEGEYVCVRVCLCVRARKQGNVVQGRAN